MKENGIGRKPLPKSRKKNYYRYLCEVADFMNEEFKLECSTDRAVVMKIDGKWKIVVLKVVAK